MRRRARARPASWRISFERAFSSCRRQEKMDSLVEGCTGKTRRYGGTKRPAEAPACGQAVAAGLRRHNTTAHVAASSGFTRYSARPNLVTPGGPDGGVKPLLTLGSAPTM